MIPNAIPNASALIRIAVAAAAIAASPLMLPAQAPASGARATTSADTSAVTVLARAAIQKFFPSVLTDTTDPGTLFVIVGPDGQLLNAAHGTMEDADKLKAKYESYDDKVESMEIKSVPAGALLPRALQVVITTFRQ